MKMRSYMLAIFSAGKHKKIPLAPPAALLQSNLSLSVRFPSSQYAAVTALTGQVSN